MAIPVTCPSCFKRFSVSDKFAGKTGPCPACQKPIKIPEKSEEVVIHAPDTATPKDSTGKSILSPVRRKEVKLGMPVILGASLGAVTVFAIAIGLRLSGDAPPTGLLAPASFLLGLPLVFVGYWFLQDDELEGFRGRPLLLRCALAALIFAVTWALYAFLPMYISGYESMAEISGLEMAIFIALMIAVGTAASVLIFELEVTQGILHYMLYFAVTFALAWLAGTPLSAPLTGGAAGTPAPTVTEPGPAGQDKPSAPVPPATPEQKIPNLLQ